MNFLLKLIAKPTFKVTFEDEGIDSPRITDLKHSGLCSTTTKHMDPDLISLRQNNIVYQLSTDGRTLTIKMKNDTHFNPPVTDGKHTLSHITNMVKDIPKDQLKYRAWEWGEVKHVIIKWTGKKSPAFMGYYLFFPPGIEPSRWPLIDLNPYAEKVHFEHRISRESLLHFIHHMSVQQRNDNNGEPQVGTFADTDPFFRSKKATATVKIPVGGKAQLEDLLDKTITKLQNSDVPTKKMEQEAKAHKLYLEEHVEEIKDCDEEGSRVIPKDSGAQEFHKPITIEEEERSNLINGQVLNVTTDETTHLSLKERTLFIVDAGFEGLPDYLCQLSCKFDHTVFMPTHFHDDHIAQLANAIQMVLNLGKQVTLLNPGNTSGQLFSYLATHHDIFFDDEQLKPKLQIKILKTKVPLTEESENRDSGENITLGEIEVSAIGESSLLKHFIENAGYTVWDSNNKVFSYYTGDMNPQPGTPNPKDTIKAFEDHLKWVAKKGVKKGAKEIKIYYDFGHFPPPYEEGLLAQNLEAEIEKVTGDDILLHLIPEHVKNTDGHNKPQLHVPNTFNTGIRK